MFTMFIALIKGIVVKLSVTFHNYFRHQRVTVNDKEIAIEYVVRLRYHRTMARQVEVALGEIWRVVPSAFLESLRKAGAQAQTTRSVRGNGRRDVLVPECWVEVPIGGSGWVAAAQMVSRGHTADVAEIRIYPAEPTEGRPKGEWGALALGARATCPPGGITARLLRRVPLGIFARASAEFIAQFYGKYPKEFQRVGLQPALPAPRRRRPVPDVVVAGIAAAYAEAVARGSRRPVEETAAVFPGAPLKRVRQLVYEARQRALLTSAPKQGAHGGRLTTKGRGVLGDLYQEPGKGGETEAKSAKRSGRSSTTSRRRT